MDYKRWLSPLDIYKELGISKSTQAKMRMKRIIPFLKIGRFVRYDRLEINEWLEQNKVVTIK